MLFKKMNLWIGVLVMASSSLAMAEVTPYTSSTRVYKLTGSDYSMSPETAVQTYCSDVNGLKLIYKTEFQMETQAEGFLETYYVYEAAGYIFKVTVHDEHVEENGPSFTEVECFF